MTKGEATKTHRTHAGERGHIAVGLTIAGVLVIILLILAPRITGTKSLSGLLDFFLSQPWWVQLLVIVVPIVLLIAGAVFDRSSEWPKSL